MTAHSKQTSDQSQDHPMGSSASIALPSDLERAHQALEFCIGELELITSEATPDKLAVGRARMKIGQANLAKRRIVHDACAQLAGLLSSHEADAVRQLQMDDLEMFPLISRHIQYWTALRVQGDWSGYCQAFRALAMRVRKSMSAETMLLYPLLQRHLRQ